MKMSVRPKRKTRFLNFLIFVLLPLMAYAQHEQMMAMGEKMPMSAFYGGYAPARENLPQGWIVDIFLHGIIGGIKFSGWGY